MYADLVVFTSVDNGLVIVALQVRHFKFQATLRTLSVKAILSFIIFRIVYCIIWDFVRFLHVRRKSFPIKYKNASRSRSEKRK